LSFHRFSHLAWLAYVVAVAAQTKVKQLTSRRIVSPEKQRRPYGPPCHKRHAGDKQKGFGPRQYPIASHVRLNCWTVSELAREGYQAVISLAYPI
jgi:hypothetical protein